MIVTLPVSLSAQEAQGAMLRSSGGVWVNQQPALASVALLHDDLIETHENVVARIEASGSTADLSPQTQLQFEGNELVLDHGSVSVNTSRSMRVRVGCLVVTPVNPDWTYYDVEDVNGKVTVFATRNDVYIEERSSKPEEEVKPDRQHSDRTIVHEGERKSRSEKCGGAYLQVSQRVAANGAILNSIWAKLGGGIVAGGITCFALCKGDDPISPSKMK